ncbi:hypothetical protein SeMB42_g03619 [Synchytrium endobioticum]|uniref:PAN2-PAN3 deadenylation complex catalytic subunit PAN2 n=1 Tax=Synchytrium endobioticum TaxID=286115 RepID=A0A507CMJ6_9FUNG|nr:hypothetical protein SeLEV6574_g06967 [Synchytrium endobioticum]TPX46595.1 hypothetical protein SeMB42_g03619 [Synchytrium endobioticum]
MDARSGRALHEIQRIGTSTRLHAISCIALDPSEELIWTGNTNGRLTSFAHSSNGLHKYTAFKAHNETVSQIAITDYGVYSVGGNTLRFTSMRGLPLWTVQDENVSKMLSICLPTTPTSNELVIGGLPDKLMLVNIHRGTLTRHLDGAGVETKILRKSSRLLCCDMDVAGHTLVSCGSSERSGTQVREPLVKIFDLRAMRSLPPVSFTAKASFVKFLPKLSSTALITSAKGTFQICDVLNSTSSIQFYAIEGIDAVPGQLTAFDVSSSGGVFIFGDATGVLYQFADHVESRINMYSRPSEYAAPPQPETYIGLDEDRPLNSIGLPYYTTPLLSVFPNTSIPAHQPPAFIPPEILSSMKLIDFVGYARNPGAFKRNQRLKDTSKENLEVPKFRSEQERAQIRQKAATPTPADTNLRDATSSNNMSRNTNVENNRDSLLPGNDPDKVPKVCRLVEIKYSKFGVEDFDFAFYNKTLYSGLETHIQSSYCNSIIQVLFFNRIFREIAKAHIRLPCSKEFCLTCELGFLFRMLEDGRGVNCQASNFLRAFATTPQAAGLGLLEPDVVTTPVSYSSMIQSCNRFILEQAHQECMGVGISYPIIPSVYNASSSPLSLIQQLYGHPSSTMSKCDVCGNAEVRNTISFVVDMTYRKASHPSSSKVLQSSLPPFQSFNETLQTSLRRGTTTRAWCSHCNKYQPLTQIRALRQLPVVLNVNAFVSESGQSGWWTPGWASARFAMSIKEDDVMVEDAPARGECVPDGLVLYELVSVISEVIENSKTRHLISHIRVDEANGTKNWYIFNDFLVDQIPESNVLDFKEWRLPCVLQFRRVDADAICNLDPLPKTVDASTLKDSNLLNRRHDLVINYTPLSPEETQILKGALCALDAEFIALNKEESEVRSDGVKQVVRPSRLGLARVSVLRGFGANETTPFIDDYISTTEEVVDYLTDYSGISPGDLDPAVSIHPLVPLKVAYKKLRMLVDMGCVFVGHGLKKDLRIINLLVPPEQIIDTVDLFYVKERQRRISLRFLAWYLLGEQIQAESHDSVEDARTALMLYQKYKEMVQIGQLESMLEELYEEGRALNFKVPTIPTEANGMMSLLGDNSPSLL